jgi:hypothetical protein
LANQTLQGSGQRRVFCFSPSFRPPPDLHVRQKTMNIEISEPEYQMIKLASSEVDAWYFNKYLALIMIAIGSIAAFSLFIYGVATLGMTNGTIINFASSLVFIAIISLWLKSNWKKTNKELAIDLIYSKLKESA